jgi:hypothetical protein
VRERERERKREREKSIIERRFENLSTDLKLK